MRSATAHVVTAIPKMLRYVPAETPARTMLTPKRILKTQNGIPIVQLRKIGRRKNRCIASVSSWHVPLVMEPGVSVMMFRIFSR